MEKLKGNILNDIEIQDLKGRCDDFFKSVINSQNEFEKYISSGKTDFGETLFNCDAVIANIEIEGKLDFSHSYFVGSLVLSSIIFYEKIDFINTKFGEKLVVDKCQFNKEIEFSESDLPKGSRFSQARFNEYAVFINVKFQESTEFVDCKFIGGSDFTGSVFSSLADFSRCIFTEKAYFLSTRFSDKAVFDYSDFAKDVDFKEWFSNKPKDGIISMERVNFNGNVYFQGRTIDRLNLSQSTIDGKLYIYEASIKKGNRDTYCIIKNEFIKQNNKIEALKFHSKEMSEYWTELIFKPYKIDWWILLLNTISNKNGLNPMFGIIFTLSIGLLFYSLLMKSAVIKWTDMSYWTGYFDFLMPTHSLKDLFSADFVFSVYHKVIDILGRVFVGYGIYQTIQAFRKYGKL